MKREIIIAKNSGFCFGVKRAVDTASNKNIQEKMYTLGPIIHNNDVVSKLEESNVFSIELSKIDSLNESDTIIIRSHGVSKAVMDLLNSKNLNIVDATCPYVTNIHKKVHDYHNQGYSILIVGDKNHPEVVGINGWCSNEAIITKDGSDLETAEIPKKLCVVSQTTEKQENWQKVLSILIKTSKELVALNTICSATEVRQKNAMVLSKKVDLMIVIGGKHSSNTTKLFEICKENCNNTLLIENETELSIDFLKNTDIRIIGITAGASTPDWIINQVVDKIKLAEKAE
ncbi:4-hydroxy-3-methylbut-2-enyl diphosphate reductase [Clostridium cellulovorans]|uniref:4-hydroxy-3-methylbut-2-enyl diphosphate reductase n=1 Tax=Clostridium cellulovorans (strain ATCC 35296 / DSM 3052 / OCM 3 / 743B) TaxID=573061 RepID=D9SN15_CLOC7|nr:4-hydroxy-3-methylbut-2-enyl diphosphate reductase [Clostridium cellulovorans]ADL51881.1 hydroxymethylbutenyl pyrophosphate reductase [Clostridium cellulovorans 743B]